MEEEDLDKKDLPIVRDAMLFLDYYEGTYKQIPNWAKHGATVPALNQEIREMVRCLTFAAKLQPKRPLLQRADASLDCIKHYIRIMKKHRLITPKQDEQMARYTKSIGSQLGGWMKSLHEK